MVGRLGRRGGGSGWASNRELRSAPRQRGSKGRVPSSARKRVPRGVGVGRDETGAEVRKKAVQVQVSKATRRAEGRLARGQTELGAQHSTAREETRRIWLPREVGKEESRRGGQPQRPRHAFEVGTGRREKTRGQENSKKSSQTRLSRQRHWQRWRHDQLGGQAAGPRSRNEPAQTVNFEPAPRELQP